MSDMIEAMKIELRKLPAPQPSDLYVVTLPEDFEDYPPVDSLGDVLSGPSAVQQVCKCVQEMLGCKVLVMPHGATLEQTPDEVLASVGLARVDKPVVVSAPPC